MTVYVVQGSCGEYSDSREWPIVAHYTEEAAKAHVVAATARAKELTVQSNYWEIPDGANEHDPNMQLDYTGTTYYYFAIEVR